MECVKKVKFCYYLTFLTGAKTRGGVGYKVNVMKLKFYRVSWISDHGWDNRRHEMADFNCINNLKR